MSDRPRGVLTPDDRQFLREVPDYYNGENARQSRYQRRKDIRMRIVRGLLDFRDVRTYVGPDQRKKIFGDPEANGAESDLDFHAGLQSALAWIYLGCREEGPDFAQLLETAIRRAEEDHHTRNSGDIVDVDVNFNVEVSHKYEGVDELARRIEDGERILADAIYQIPTIPDFSVDQDKVDIVRIVPSQSQLNMDGETEIVKTILREQLGVEAEVEVVGVAEVPEELKEIYEDDE